MVDSRRLTYLLSFMADHYEAMVETNGRFEPKFMKRILESKFPFLTEAQIKHIMRII